MRTLAASVFMCSLVLGAAPLFRAAALAVCGDGVIDAGEACDGANLGGQTCADVTSGFAQSGTLTCTADCKLDTTDCRRAFIESLVPATGGPRQNRCQLEWATVGTSATKGRATRRTCSEGDPGCDQDKQFDNGCTFQVQVCMNVPDPRNPSCQPARIVKFDVLAPSAAADAGKAGAALVKAASGAAPDQSHATQGSVSFGPPVTDFTCGSATFRVALRGTAGQARPGMVRLRARTSDNSGRVRAVGNLTLVCTP